MSYTEFVNNLELAIRRYKDATHPVSCIVDINILKEAFDTIKEQKAEIERLKDSVITSNIMETQEIKRDAKLEVINEFEKEIKYVKENEKYDDFNPIVDIDLCEDVLNIMKLQNEKIKEFDEKLIIQQGLIDYQKTEIEQWKEEANRWQNLCCMMNDDIQNAKLEVIKDFENKLNEKKAQSTMDKRIYSAEMIDNIIKEMMEVETNPRKEDVGK